MSEELTGWKMRSGLMTRVHMNSNVRKINKNSKASLLQTIWVGEISVQIEPDTKRVDTKRVDTKRVDTKRVGWRAKFCLSTTCR